MIKPMIYEQAETGSEESNICPDIDDACFEPNRAGCQDGLTLPLLGICPFLIDEEI